MIENEDKVALVITIHNLDEFMLNNKQKCWAIQKYTTTSVALIIDQHNKRNAGLA